MSEDYKKNEELEATEAKNNEEKAEAIEQNNNSQKEEDEVKNEASANSPKETESSENKEEREITSDKESENEKSATNEASDSEKTAEAPTENAPKESAVSSENAQSVSAKKIKKPLLISLIAGGVAFLTALTLFLILFIPIWFGNPFLNTFGELLPDTEVLEQIIEDLRDSGYEESLSVSLPRGVISPHSDLELSFLTHAVGSFKSGKGRMKLDVQTERGQIELDISYDNDKITVGGFAGEGVYVTLPRKNFEKALERSVFAPDSGSAYALDKESYESLIDALSGENAYDVYTDFFEDVLSEWEDIIDKDTSIYPSKEAFKLYKDVTYTVSYGNLCDMIDAFFEEMEDREEIKASFGSAETIASLKNALKQSFFENDLEFSYRAIGDRLDMARLVISDGKVDTEFTLNTEDEDGTLSLSMKTYIRKGKEESEIVFKYATSEDENTKKAYITLCDDNEKTPDVDIYTFEYDKLSHRYKINLAIGKETLFRMTGNFEIYDENEGYAFDVETLFLLNEYYGSLHYEIKRDTSAKGVTLESGINILTESEEEINEIISKSDISTIVQIVFDLTGRTVPGYSVYTSKTLEEETMNAVYAFRQYRETYGNKSKSRIYYYSDTFEVYIIVAIENYSEVSSYKEELSPSELQTYYNLRSDPSFEQHAFELIEKVDPLCTEAGYKRFYCHLCGLKYDQSLPQTGHNVVEKTIENYMHDNGQVYSVKVFGCEYCERPYSFEIGEELAVRIDEYAYPLSIRSVTGGKHFAIPKEILKDFEKYERADLGIHGEYGFISVRVPYNVKVLSNGGFGREKNIEVIVISNTLEKLDDDVFYENIPLRVIFFEGTEEEWNAIDLGVYRERWADVEVIFRPGGVSGEEVYASFAHNAADSLEEKKALTENIDAAEELAANNENVEVLYSGAVNGTVVFSESESIFAFVSSVNESGTVIGIYSAQSGTLLENVSINDSVSIFDLSDKYLVAYGLNQNLLTIVNMETGETKTVQLSNKKSTEDVINVFVDGDNVIVIAFDGELSSIFYYSVISEEIAYMVNYTYSNTFIFNKKAHRILSFINSRPLSVNIYDTLSMTRVKYLYDVKIDAVRTGDFKYGYVLGYNGSFYDVNGNELSDVFDTAIAPTRGEYAYPAIIISDRASVYMMIKTGGDGEARLVINTASGERIELLYYAEMGFVTSEGDLILYTPGGYGIIKVDLP